MNDDYFSRLSAEFGKAYEVAQEARKKGVDPHTYVEIRPAPDLASRVEGLTGVEGIGDLIRRLNVELKDPARSKLAFGMAKEICTSDAFADYDDIRRVEMAVKVGTAILTEGILVAPTEGIRGIDRYRNNDGTDYIAISYAGPIRGAGGTAAALSVALADYSRKFFKIGNYKPTLDEVERYVEETELYHMRAARLQYRPPDDDIRVIVQNCPVCVDGVPTENIEVSVHGNLKRIDFTGKEVAVTNRVRGGVPLVICEGIAQKSKKLLKETKSVGLEWDWLNNIIKLEVKKVEARDDTAVFLEELVAGRPILSYPNYIGGFRLRYGRSRFTGIAAKGISPASMLVLKSFIATGTQLKIEFPGKGCVAMPVDSIEGPFVKLASGETLRIDDVETANRLKDEVVEILSLGDILVTYGDFRKSNTLLKPSSYVEEMWEAQLGAVDKSARVDHKTIDFATAYRLSLKYGIPLHPKFLFEFQGVEAKDMVELAFAIIRDSDARKHESLFGIELLKISFSDKIKRTLELLNVPHKPDSGFILVGKDYAQSLVASLGFASGEEGALQVNELVIDKYKDMVNSVDLVNSVAPFRVMKRSTFIGTRIGRPEKAKERLMKPAPNVLFPLGDYGGKERNVTTAYSIDSKKFKSGVTVEIARYRCGNCKRIVDAPYCYDCQMKAEVEYYCQRCEKAGSARVCERCGQPTVAYETRSIDLSRVVSKAMANLGIGKLPKVIKGVRGMTNRDKYTEVIEKGILRSMNMVYIFKDGTSRFDATDVPITHFYPDEIGVSVGQLKAMGYDKDYKGDDLIDGKQLVELRHQDVIMNRRGGDYMLRTARFVDDMLVLLYKRDKFYNVSTLNDMIGKLVITLSPHTSCGVLNRIIGFTNASVGFAHPYTISARRRNCDGDEDTTMLLLDALINFSREYLPSTVGGTMDTPLILTLNVKPEEVDDEVHAMEVAWSYSLEFYEKTMAAVSPSNVKMELVEDRLGKEEAFSNIGFTHHSSISAVSDAPKRSQYTQLKTMQEKLDAEFNLMDMILAVNKRDAARKVIISHFIPDLIGNLHSFSKQVFRCSSCNTKFRRVPLSGKCMRDGGKLVLTISKGGIEKYLEMAIALAERYNLDNYIKQRLYLVRDEINSIFNYTDEAAGVTEGQFSLLKFV